MGQLKPEVWTACIAFMDALQKTDYALMAENMLKMGMTAVKIDTQVLAADLERLFRCVVGRSARIAEFKPSRFESHHDG